MAGPIYVSNPTLWGQFLHTNNGENFIPLVRYKSQKGGGILNKRRAYMIPIKSSSPSPAGEVQQVSPVTAEQERAVSELKETMRNDKPHMPLESGIKRKKKQKSVRHSTASKRKGRFKEKKKQGQKRIKSLKRKQKKIKKKTAKKKKTKSSNKRGSKLKGAPIF
jgi:hypothetical protein